MAEAGSRAAAGDGDGGDGGGGGGGGTKKNIFRKFKLQNFLCPLMAYIIF